MKTAFYSGSFDPPTRGHLDIIQRGFRLFDRLIIGIGVHPSKRPIFSAQERIDILSHELSLLDHANRLQVVTFSGLVIDAAQDANAQIILRGIRDASDLGYEMQMAGMNAAMAPQIETVFLTASSGLNHVSSTFVRQIAIMKGDVSAFVSPFIVERLQEKFQPA